MCSCTLSGKDKEYSGASTCTPTLYINKPVSSAIIPSSFIKNKFIPQFLNLKRKLKWPFLNMKFISIFNAT